MCCNLVARHGEHFWSDNHRCFRNLEKGFTVGLISFTQPSCHWGLAVRCPGPGIGREEILRSQGLREPTSVTRRSHNRFTCHGQVRLAAPLAALPRPNPAVYRWRHSTRDGPSPSPRNFATCRDSYYLGYSVYCVLNIEQDLLVVFWEA
jgi:hypothetical protein